MTPPQWRLLAWAVLGAAASGGALWVCLARARPAWLTRLGPPLCAFLLARFLFWAGFAVAPLHSVGGYRMDGSPAAVATRFDHNAWVRWDSAVYLTIAQRGYELYPCAIPLDGVPLARAGTGMWCGDTQWFPLYPGAIALLAQVGIPHRAGAVLLSAAFCLAALWLVWTGFLGASRSSRSVGALLLAALFPGAIYYHAAYPVGMAVFFQTASMLLLVRGRWLAAAAAGALATAAYPGSIFIAVVLGLSALFLVPGERWPRRLGRAFAAGAVVGVGFLAVVIVQGLSVGSWDAFLRTQIQYDVSDTMPLLTLRPIGERFTRLAAIDWSRASVAEWRQLLVPVAVLFAAVAAALPLIFVRKARESWRLPGAATSPVLPLCIFLAVFWIMPLALPRYSLVRRQSLMFTAVPLAVLLPGWVQAPLILAAGGVAVVAGALYYAGLLI